MLNESDIKTLIEQTIADARVTIHGDGRHFEAVIISDSFLGLSSLKRQQAVYAVIGQEITSGAIHAISFKTYTTLEWQELQ